MRRAIKVVAGLAVAGCLAAGLPAGPAAAEKPAGAGTRAEIDAVIADYVGLYAGATLERWKGLFHPAVSVSFPADDGSITVRNLEEFFQRQKNYFATGRRISERLENVRVEEGRRIARVTADFVFVDEGKESRGRLGLHLARDKNGFKIVAVLFAYDQP